MVSLLLISPWPGDRVTIQRMTKARGRQCLTRGVLGAPVKDTETCSKCGGKIADEHVPLIMWADGRAILDFYKLSQPAYIR